MWFIIIFNNIYVLEEFKYHINILDKYGVDVPKETQIKFKDIQNEYYFVNSKAIRFLYISIF